MSEWRRGSHARTSKCEKKVGVAAVAAGGESRAMTGIHAQLKISITLVMEPMRGSSSRGRTGRGKAGHSRVRQGIMSRLGQGRKGQGTERQASWLSALPAVRRFRESRAH